MQNPQGNPPCRPPLWFLPNNTALCKSIKHSKYRHFLLIGQHRKAQRLYNNGIRRTPSIWTKSINRNRTGKSTVTTMECGSLPIHDNRRSASHRADSATPSTSSSGVHAKKVTLLRVPIKSCSLSKSTQVIWQGQHRASNFHIGDAFAEIINLAEASSPVKAGVAVLHALMPFWCHCGVRRTFCFPGLGIRLSSWHSSLSCKLGLLIFVVSKACFSQDKCFG